MSIPSPIVIIGAGGHATVVCDIVRLTGDFVLAGFLDTVNTERHGESFCGATILGGLEQLDVLARRGVRRAIVAVGDCGARLQLAERAASTGMSFPVVIHPSAIRASDVAAGPGTVVMAGAILNPGVTLGAHVIVNTGASIDHDSVIGDGVHVAVGARLAGRVSVGSGTWIGMGALIKEGVRIGSGSMIGAGALVLKDLPDGVTAYGSPAKVVHASSHSSITR